MKNHLILSYLLLACCLQSTVAAAGKNLVNIDKNGVGLQGYDPVAFFTDKKPIKGNPAIHHTYQGATYHFVSTDHRSLFSANPARFAPQFGGYCAYGVTKGTPAPIRVDAFQIVNDRLLLQYDSDIRDQFSKDPIGNLRKADENWPALVEKKGKPSH
jgi:YHS domain-containing protein